VSTNISVIDDYTMSIVRPQPVVTMGALPLQPVVEAAVEEPVEEPVVEEAKVEAKVVKAPAAKTAPASTEGVETK